MHAEGLRALSRLPSSPKPSALPTLKGEAVWFRGRLGVVFGQLGIGDRGVSRPDDTKTGNQT
jgi:hypothetical protein